MFLLDVREANIHMILYISICILKANAKELHMTNKAMKDVAIKQELSVLTGLSHQVPLWLEVHV
jgi:hypothetical protein